MRVTVIDGQGGGLGRQLVARLKAREIDCELHAAGTNSVATAAMRRAGADTSATGENAVIFAARRSDVLMGPIGVVIADAMLGEITPTMALAIGQSEARRVLVPVNQGGTWVAGVGEQALAKLIEAAVDEVARLAELAAGAQPHSHPRSWH